MVFLIEYFHFPIGKSVVIFIKIDDGSFNKFQTFKFSEFFSFVKQQDFKIKREKFKKKIII